MPESNNRRAPYQGRSAHSMDIRGLKISTVSYVMMAVAALVYVLLIYKSYQLEESNQKLMEATRDFFAACEDARRVSEASDYLTDQVRMFSIELNRVYVDNYFQEAKVNRRRDIALSNLKMRPIGDDTVDYFQKAVRYSNELMDTEFYAMRLIVDAANYRLSAFPTEIIDVKLKPEDAALSPQDKIWKARALLFDSNYQRYKSLIKNNLALSYQSIVDAMADVQRHNDELVQANMAQQMVCITLLFLLTIAIFVAVLVFVVRPVHGYMENIRAGRLLELKGAYEFRYLASTYNSILRRNLSSQEQLKHKAEHDFLTGLMNRSSFADICDMLRDSGDEIAMIIVDVDLFKQINDKYGHDTGDKILQKVSKLLTKSTRSTDSVFRLGGDEFCVIMTYITPKDKKLIADKFGRINDDLQHPMDGLPIASISVGVAFSLVGYRDKLYLNADKALYDVKRAQRGGVNFFETAIEE